MPESAGFPFDFVAQLAGCGHAIGGDFSWEKKITKDFDFVTWNVKSFRGIGGFTKKNTTKETKTGKLLNDLATYLSGFDKSLRHLKPSAVFVVLDNDKRDQAAFARQLKELAARRNITIDHVFCIAVEEVEAWLLGDREAVIKAYPRATE